MSNIYPKLLTERRRRPASPQRKSLSGLTSLSGRTVPSQIAERMRRLTQSKSLGASPTRFSSCEIHPAGLPNLRLVARSSAPLDRWSRPPPRARLRDDAALPAMHSTDPRAPPNTAQLTPAPSTLNTHESHQHLACPVPVPRTLSSTPPAPSAPLYAQAHKTESGTRN
ncbi:hypothetical protein B0H17DRAFT_1135388 [Mycena rosella]|uniref:Uncharacterized protein n=1 Tax=Mycena rosella TaxID=1033263 RepID=A0AAD7GCZ5_MYCRO|nr:hypothetical protein B0H17DRAFT_1135388 [Mycena rosella]